MTVSLIGLPTVIGLAIVADDLFLVAFGRQWLPSVVPFRILCGVGVLKLLNPYASAAAQARGWIWPEVWRQSVYAISIAVGIAFASRWGITGAAAAVFVATGVMFVLMQHMLLRATGLTVQDVLAPLAPAAIAAVAVGAAALAAGGLLTSVERRWLVLLIQLTASAVAYVLFLLLSRAPEVRTLVDDFVDDIRRRRRLRPANPPVPPAASSVPN
jgi:O-antigen/teichoic acid export membrane protein